MKLDKRTFHCLRCLPENPPCSYLVPKAWDASFLCGQDLPGGDSQLELQTASYPTEGKSSVMIAQYTGAKGLTRVHFQE